jgi:hypothetical protein
MGWQNRKFKIKASGTGAFGDNPEDRRSACRIFGYAAMKKDEAQRRYWTFYEAIKVIGLKSGSYSGFHSGWGWKILL